MQNEEEDYEAWYTDALPHTKCLLRRYPRPIEMM